MAPKVCFLGAVRRRTMICCRNVKISASSAARDRNRSTTAQTRSLKRSLITEQHRPILGQPPVNRFETGTAPPISPDMIFDRHRLTSADGPLRAATIVSIKDTRQPRHAKHGIIDEKKQL